MKARRFRGKGGFSLVEVCLAVLVVGLGLLSIFAVFPTGLAASEAAASDTETGLFAERVLMGLHAVASEVSGNSDWVKWIGNNFDVPGIQRNQVLVVDGVAYYLTLSEGATKAKQATLCAIPWRASAPPPLTMVQAGNVFYTEIYYTELP